MPGPAPAGTAAQQQQQGTDWFAQNAPPDYQANYWAQDRPQVLASMGLTDTSGKVWNGTGWVAGSAPTGGGSTTGGASGQTPQAYYQSLFPPGSRVTPQDLLAHEADLKAHGITLIKNAEGQPGKVSLADGSAFDVIQGAGTGNGISQWSQIAGPGGTPTGGGTQSLGDFGTGSLAQGFNQTFTAPTEAQMAQTPGYQFALNQGIDALDKRAAAQGTVLGGGEKKNVLEFATGLADQTAQQQYQNALGEYQQAYNIFRGNQSDVFNRFNTLATEGTSAANAATS